MAAILKIHNISITFQPILMTFCAVMHIGPLQHNGCSTIENLENPRKQMATTD